MTGLLVELLAWPGPETARAVTSRRLPASILDHPRVADIVLGMTAVDALDYLQRSVDDLLSSADLDSRIHQIHGRSILPIAADPDRGTWAWDAAQALIAGWPTLFDPAGPDPIRLLNAYGQAKFGDEWWPVNPHGWVDSDTAAALVTVLISSDSTRGTDS